VHALTDVTGYGLAGHACEMAEAASLTFAIEAAKLPVIEGAEPLAIPRYHTRASKTNREFVAGRLENDAGIDPVRLEFAFDAQTSGGLLIAIAADRVAQLIKQLQDRGTSAAAIVGRVEERDGNVAIRLR
jgi:selenide,water dikinase